MGLPLVITMRNEVMCNIQGLTVSDKNILYKKLSAFIPQARFMPKYKLGLWDGYIHYFDANCNVPIGLLQEGFGLIDMKNYDVSVIPYQGCKLRPKFEPIDEALFADFTWEEGHRLAGEPVMLEEHQVYGVNALLAVGKGIIEFGTGAGKTLMTAAICKRVCPFGKMLIIVPSTDLVKNTTDQLVKLGFDCGAVIKDGAKTIAYSKPVVVITWQSLLSMNRRIKGQGYWKDQIKEAELESNKLLAKNKYEELKAKQAQIRVMQQNLKDDQARAREELDTLTDGVVGFLFDEVHTAKGNEIRTILTDMFPYVQVRYGMTGTVPKEAGDRFCILGGIGPVVAKMSAHDLQERGFLADSEIKILQLKDNKHFADYQSEVEYLATDTTRLNYIADYLMYVVKTSGNTLVLVNRIKTGSILEQIIKDKGGDAVFLSGKDSVKDRDEQYKQVNIQDDKLIIATANIAATGINMPRLMNLVFLDAGKSFVRTIQSIGRGLRLGRDKTKVMVHDINSALKWQKAHLTQRKKYYTDAKIPATMIKIDDWMMGDASFK